MLAIFQSTLKKIRKIGLSGMKTNKRIGICIIIYALKYVSN